eukprot:gene26305-17399_t
MSQLSPMQLKVHARVRAAQSSGNKNGLVQADHRLLHLRDSKTGNVAEFVLDGVLDADATQEVTFQRVGQGLCDEVLKGYNSCCFVYGSSGAGRTFSLFGVEHSGQSWKEPGLIAQSASYILGGSKAAAQRSSCFVSLAHVSEVGIRDLGRSAQEYISNGSLPSNMSAKTGSIDLVDDPKTKTTLINGLTRIELDRLVLDFVALPTSMSAKTGCNDLVDDPKTKTTLISGLTHIELDRLVLDFVALPTSKSAKTGCNDLVDDPKTKTTLISGLTHIEIKTTLTNGLNRMEVGKMEDVTNILNAVAAMRSSAQLAKESTLVFTISHILQQDRAPPLTAHINFVLLPGGTAGRSPSDPKGALGQVLASLTKQGNTAPIRYQQSKLTHLLRDSLQRTSAVALLACLHPTAEKYSECLQDLQFAAKCQNLAGPKAPSRGPSPFPQSVSPMLSLSAAGGDAALAKQVSQLQQELEYTHSHYNKLLASVAGPDWYKDIKEGVERGPGEDSRTSTPSKAL